MSHAEPAPAAEEGGKPAKPLMKKIKVGATIAVIVLLQCFIVSTLLPSGGEPKAHASTKSETPAHEPAHGEEHHESADGEQTEVDLGAFSLTVFNPSTSSNLLV